MPEYKDILRNDMQEYMNIIKAMLDKCKHRFSFYVLDLIVILLYEYCLCYSYFDLNPSISVLNGQKITQNHIYAYLRKHFPEYDFHTVCEAFMRVRHSLAQLSAEHRNHTRVKTLLTMPDFFELLYTFDFPTEVLESLQVIAQTVESDEGLLGNLPGKVEEPQKIEM